MKLSFWSIGIILAALCPLDAAILISNPSFENPVLVCAAGPTCFSNTITGWSVTGLSSVFKPDATNVNLPVPEGVQVLADGYGSSGDVSQDTGVAIVSGATYTLTVSVGARLDLPFSLYHVSLLAGGSTLVTDSTLTPTAGNFLVDTLTYTAKPGDTGTLSVDLFGLGSTTPTAVVNAQALFDNVGLDVALPADAPEPSAFVLGGLGLIPIFLRRRRS